MLEAVLEAAMEELGRVGFAALRIEDVAARSGVNKTTIYRRWPTKLDLMAAVLLHIKEPPTAFDNGSLIEDVRASLLELRERLSDARHRAMVQVLMAERMHPDVSELVTELRQRHVAARSRIFERAIARGELPRGIDTNSLVEFMTAPLVTRIVNQSGVADDAFIELLVQVVCNGARTL